MSNYQTFFCFLFQHQGSSQEPWKVELELVQFFSHSFSFSDNVVQIALLPRSVTMREVKLLLPKNIVFQHLDCHATAYQLACPHLNSIAQLSSVVNNQGKRSMKMAITSSRPLVHFNNKGQILGLILENKAFQNLKLPKNVQNKKCAPKLIFLNEFFLKDSGNF